MRVHVDLNSHINSFQIKPIHERRLSEEFPQHDFVFNDSYKDLKENIAEAEAALVWQFPEHLFQQAIKLKLLCTPAAGKDWVAVDPSGAVQNHFSSFHGEIISESFLTMLLAVNNRLVTSLKSQSAKEWGRNEYAGRKLLKNQSLLIIGFGSIGQKCAEVAMSLGMSVTGVSRSKKTNGKLRIIHPEELADEISHFDHILNLLPGGKETEKFVSRELITKMNSSASFYNFGRGTTVDEHALIDALKAKEIFFAGLDVMEKEPLPLESELWSLENVILTPHSSCCYEDYLHLFIDELKDVL
ncbi:MAG: hypothetical protein NE334_19310 [Lentisphaeraceae bacterium]|nr:hypothetical protein [Lentisphaeraceae bacterium]